MAHVEFEYKLEQTLYHELSVMQKFWTDMRPTPLWQEQQSIADALV